MKTLDEVRTYLNDIPFISCGGCGISSLSIYRWLKKHNKHSKVTLVFLYKDWRNEQYINNQNILRNISTGEPGAPSHACLYIKKKFVDEYCDNIDTSEYKYIQNFTEEQFLVRTNNNIGSWNPSFDRDNIRDIEKALKIDLSDILT